MIWSTVSLPVPVSLTDIRMCFFCLIFFQNHELRAGFGDRTGGAGLAGAQGQKGHLPALRGTGDGVRSSPLSNAPAQSSAFCREGEGEGRQRYLPSLPHLERPSSPGKGLILRERWDKRRLPAW